MIIGVTKEIKNNENHVGLTLTSTEALYKAGQTPFCGMRCSGFIDES